jgi:hypothetical protein
LGGGWPQNVNKEVHKSKLKLIVSYTSIFRTR